MRLSVRCLTIPIGLTTLATLASAAGAQLSSSLGVSAASARPAGAAWEPAPALSATVRYDRPWFVLQGDGAAGSAFERTWHGTGSAYGAVATPDVRGFRASLAASWARSPWLPDASGAPRAATQASARLSWRRGAGGAWAGFDQMSVFGPDSATAAPRLGLGLWRQIGGAVLTLTVGQQSAWVGSQSLTSRQTSVWDTVFTVDSSGGVPVVTATAVERFQNTVDSGWGNSRARWSEVEAGFSWARGRVALDGIVGGRPQILGVPAAAWGRLDGSVLLDPRVALVAGAGTAPRRLGLGVPARSYASFGMRLMRSPFRHKDPLPSIAPETRTVAAAFQVRPVSGSHYVLAIRVPRARVVELSGDFTAWKPVTMRRVSADQWEAAFALTPGTYRLNIRVDGERWTAPPGTTAVADEFNGTVGVVVIK